MGIQIEKRGVTTKEDLRAALRETWDSITPEVLQRCMATMPERCRLVLEANGATIEY